MNEEEQSNQPTPGEATTAHDSTPPKRRWAWIVALLAVVAIAGTVLAYRSGWFEQPDIAGAPAAAEAKETYYCPMHPQQQSDKPDNCPICNMKMVKLEKAPATGSASMPGMSMDGDKTSPTTASQAPAANAIYIAPERQQLIGVKSVEAEIRPLTREVRTIGKVAFDETKITHIHTKVAGFIDEVFVDYIGKPVKKGQPLFTIYSPDLVATQEEYLLALKSKRTLADSSFSWIAEGSDNLLEAARRRLLLWDITPAQIRRLEVEGTVHRTLTIHSPVDGVVTQRAAYHHGRHVTPETELYTIVDLSTVWLLGEVYEYELPFIKVGQIAEVEFPYTSGTLDRQGRVVFISPTLDPKTRTAELRLEFRNPNLTLRPDMFVDFRLKIPLGRRLVVPQDAVLRTGTEQYVFLDKGEGYFEPREIELGPQSGDLYAIESGLRAGERVVTAANFILDSESRLKGAFASMGKGDPVALGGPAAGGQKLQVDILEPKTAKTGANDLRLSVKDSTGAPIEGADVQVTLFMPQMGSMAPMTSKAELKHVGGGIYAGRIDVPMAWTWDTTITVSKGGQNIGVVKTTLTAR